MPFPPYGAGSGLPSRSSAVAPTIFQVPTIDGIPPLLSLHLGKQLTLPGSAAQPSIGSWIAEDIPMEFGASIFFTDYSITPAELGQALEERGFDSVWAAEHSHIPVPRKTRADQDLGKR